MRLNSIDEQLLAGDNGPAAELAMNILVDLGNIYGAEMMIPISQAHIDMTLYMVDAGVEFAERMANLGGRFAVPTQLNPASIDLTRYKALRVPEDLLKKSRKLESAYMKMGAMPTWTCAPYQQGIIPSYGDQVAWGESNAVAYVNSVIGARTERYADLTDICAAITGRVPAIGLHLEENRKAELLLSLDNVPESLFEDPRVYPILGYLFGQLAGDRIAVLDGIPGTPNEDQLKAFSAAAASSGAVGLFHLPGITPEAADVHSCFPDGRITDRLIITKSMLEAAARKLNHDECRSPDLITLGCPHYSIAEFKKVEALLADRTINENIEFWIFTSRNTYAEIESSGHLTSLSRSGIKVFTDGCPLQFPKTSWEFNCVMSDSGKYANYCFSQTGLKTIFASVEECVETAVAGTLIRRPLWK